MALKSQTRSAGSVENVSVGGDSWSSLDSVKTDDLNYAVESGGGLSDILNAYNFGFEIPMSSKIVGVKALVKKSCILTGGSFPTRPKDYLICLNESGVSMSENKAVNAYWSSSLEEIEYGSSSDDWNAILTRDVINDSTFGFSIQTTQPNFTSGYFTDSAVYYIEVTVYYEDIVEPEFQQEQIIDESEKQFYAKIYDINGVYLTTLKEDDFDWQPKFTLNINDGLSMMTAKLAHSIDDFKYPSSGEISDGGRTIETIKGVDRLRDGIKFGNIIKFFITDKETINKQIYAGYIAGFNITKEKEQEIFNIEILPNVARMTSLLLRDGDDTTVSFNSLDPSDIITQIIDDSPITTIYTDDTIYNTGVSRTYEFVGQTVLDALKKVTDLSPYGWFFYVGGDDYIYFKNFTNYNQVKKHRIDASTLLGMSASRSIFDLRNRVYFLGGGDPQMYRVYNSTGSQNSFGLFEERQVDERVTTPATADSIVESFLLQKNKPSAQLEIEIMDSNYSKKGYDIESINPGDTIVLQDENFSNSETRWGYFTWGQSYWLYDIYQFIGVPAYVQSINYQYDRAIVNCSFEFPFNENRIEDINRDLTNYRFKDAPTAPTGA